MRLAGLVVIVACGSSTPPSPAPAPPAVVVTVVDEPVDAAPSVDEGKEIYGQYCEGCHTIDGTPRVGPTLKHYFGATFTLLDGTEVTGSRDRVSIALAQPDPLKGYPATMECCMAEMLGKARVAALIAFITTLQ